LERVKKAETTPAPASVPVPGHAEIAALVARLDELENELARLQHAVDTAQAPPVEREFTPITPAAGAVAPAPAPAQSASQPLADPWTTVRASATQPVGLDPDWTPVQDAMPKHRVATWNIATAGALEPAPLLTPDPSAAEIDAAFENLTGGAASEAIAPRPRWEAGADLFLPEAAGEDVAVPVSRPVPPAAAQPRLEDTAFPHFVGKPVRPIPDRLEVTYEGNQGEEVVDLPASALLFEPESHGSSLTAESEPIDLRSLGATEFDT
jgi:hypothetical protein